MLMQRPTSAFCLILRWYSGPVSYPFSSKWVTFSIITIPYYFDHTYLRHMSKRFMATCKNLQNMECYIAALNHRHQSPFELQELPEWKKDLWVPLAMMLDWRIWSQLQSRNVPQQFSMQQQYNLPWRGYRLNSFQQAAIVPCHEANPEYGSRNMLRYQLDSCYKKMI